MLERRRLISKWGKSDAKLQADLLEQKGKIVDHYPVKFVRVAETAATKNMSNDLEHISSHRRCKIDEAMSCERLSKIAE